MKSGIDNQIQSASATGPGHEQVVPSLGRPAPVPPEKRDVMDTLLGKNNLTASDMSGSDPYNATGRFFRR